jgi:hypothetical protein
LLRSRQGFGAFFRTINSEMPLAGHLKNAFVNWIACDQACDAAELLAIEN